MRHQLTIAIGATAAAGAAALCLALLPAGTQAEPDSPPTSGLTATASGAGAGAPTYPGVVAVQFDRSQAALGRGESAADHRTWVKASTELNTAVARMRGAWAATRYLIATTPPPPPPAGDRAGANGAGAGGVTYTAPPETGLGLFGLQHDLATGTAGLLGMNASLDAVLIADIRAIATVRNRAITYIHAVAPPAPPPAGRGGASGAAVASTFDAVMPSVPALLDDEIKALRGALTIRAATLAAPIKAAIRAAVVVDQATKATINTWWPPVVADD